MSETSIKVAIMGGYGTFHEIAAHQYFRDVEVEIVTSESFDDLFRMMKRGAAQYAISAIENSVAGSILPNYQLIHDSGLQITGEIYLRVCQNLVALPGQTIEDLHEVYSHPMAILQSKPFFDKYPHIKLIDGRDTASCMRDISVNGLKGIGAIGSRFAAEKYNLEILSASIESNKRNYTRFLIMTDPGHVFSNTEIPNKSSISFALSHEIGSLAKVLSIFSYFNINLSKIQSLPIIGKEWEYLFYVDLEFSDMAMYRQSLVSAEPFISNLCQMGMYRKGKVILE
jgi:prephenate dehydratase